MNLRRSARRSLVRAGLATVGVSVAVMTGAGAVVMLLGWPGAADRGAEPDRTATGQAALQDEIDAMIAAGFAPDDPKVRLLEDELAALETLEGAPPVPESTITTATGGGDTGGREGGALAAGAEAGGVDATGATEQWDDGTVPCEPIPQRLTVEDIAGATCYVEPRADGTVRYVAVRPDGREREVLFAAG